LAAPIWPHQFGRTKGRRRLAAPVFRLAPGSLMPALNHGKTGGGRLAGADWQGQTGGSCSVASVFVNPALFETQAELNANVLWAPGDLETVCRRVMLRWV
jgi:hypothetical protein